MNGYATAVIFVLAFAGCSQNPSREIRHDPPPKPAETYGSSVEKATVQSGSLSEKAAKLNALFRKIRGE